MATTTLTTCPPSQLTSLERTRFFPRQLVTPDDLTQNQLYFREKLRRHNRLLHGWGVVCGARVKRGKEAGGIVIEPGYILGPYGDDIVIDTEIPLNVCRAIVADDPSCGEAADPWCNDVRREPGERRALYVAVRYAECKSRPVRVYPAGCACDDALCEYSRIRDSYEIAVLTSLPGTHDPMPEVRLNDALSCPSGKGHPCPPCPDEPWVILADVHLGDNCTIAQLDCYTHRRYVASFAEYYFACRRLYEPQDMPGPGDWVAQVGVEEGQAPVTRVTVQLGAHRWAFLPIYFDVEPGDTLGDLLVREGEREFLDTFSGETFTLKEIYALANVDPQATIGSIDEAVAPLEGIRLDVADLRVVRRGLENLLDKEGMASLDRDHAGAPAAATRVDAIGLKGVGKRSWLGQKVASMTINNIGTMNLGEFLNTVLADAPEERKQALEKQAREVWSRAHRVLNLSRAWDAA